MKTMTKALLVSALALACTGGVYAQAGGGSAGSSGSGGTDGGAVGNPDYGTQPGGNTLNRPSSRSRDTGGYGTPGNTGMGAGRTGVKPGDTSRSDPHSTGRTGTPAEQSDQPSQRQE